MVNLSTPRFDVVLDTPEGELELRDVQAVQADVIRYDLVRRRNGWPAIGDAPMLWTTFVCHAALVRLGHPVDPSFDKGVEQLLSVHTLDKRGAPVDEHTDPDDVGAVDPTHGRA